MASEAAPEARRIAEESELARLATRLAHRRYARPGSDTRRESVSRRDSFSSGVPTVTRIAAGRAEAVRGAARSRPRAAAPRRAAGRRRRPPRRRSSPTAGPDRREPVLAQRLLELARALARSPRAGARALPSPSRLASAASWAGVRDVEGAAHLADRRDDLRRARPRSRRAARRARRSSRTSAGRRRGGPRFRYSSIPSG